MSGVQFNISVNAGSSGAAINGVVDGMNRAAGTANSLTAAISKIGGAAFAFNNIKSAVSGIADDFRAAIQPGVDFEDNLKDLQAITGVNETQLKKIGEAARANAKTFGVEAKGAVEGYKLILSQLGPEIANNSAALAAMGNTTSALSKQMGGDTKAATETLTTAMNQYGISIEDPIQASKEMARMADIMTASAKAGSAELPNIKSALEQSGMMAKTAGVEFQELNGAIQVLDKAGKKGAEGGVAIRNVLAEISAGSLMQVKSKAVLEQSGISVAALADKNKTFSERLQLLKPIVGDNAKMIAVFGKENVAAGIALINGTADLDKYNTKLVTKNATTDYANTKMGSFKETMNRVTAQIQDYGISIFNSVKPMLPFLSVAGGAVKIAGDLGMAMNGVSTLAETKFGKAIGKAATGVWSFVKSCAAGIVSVVRQGVTMALTAAGGIGSFVVAMGTAIAAQLGLNVAMTANPIGLIIVGIAAVVGAIVLLVKYWDIIWDKIKQFGRWIVAHNPFSFLVDVIDRVLPGFKNAISSVWDWIKKKFTDLINWFKDTWNSLKGVFGFGDDTPATKESAAAMETAVTTALDKPIKVKLEDSLTDGKGGKGLTGTKEKGTKESKAMASNISSGGNRPTTINLTIHKLQDQIVVHTTNLQTGAKEAGRQIVEEILMALNSVNGKAQAAV